MLWESVCPAWQHVTQQGRKNWRQLNVIGQEESGGGRENALLDHAYVQISLDLRINMVYSETL